MRRFDASDITENHYRALRLLIRLRLAEAHIIVRSARPWPPRVFYSSRQPEADIRGDPIN
jgi:hypothetical protein